jgi:uncharacterized RDD family membrane protein YckC
MSQDSYNQSEGAAGAQYSQPANPPAYGYAPPPPVVQAAPDKVKRFVAVLIDGILVGVVAGILGAIVPILGAAAGLALYLARDVALGGQSPGKKIMGLRAVTASGGTVSINESVMRNLTLSLGSIGQLVAAIPFLGLIAIPIYLVGAVVGLYECYLVLTDQPRLGDKIAGTRVITERAQPVAA